MIFLHADDPIEITRIKIELANCCYFLMTTNGHRAELDQAIADCWKRWDALHVTT